MIDLSNSNLKNMSNNNIGSLMHLNLDVGGGKLIYFNNNILNSLVSITLSKKIE